MTKFRKSFRYGEKGFTLIELLIVIAILGVLAAVVVPNVTRFMKSGKLAAAKQELETIQTAVDAAMAEQGWTEVVGTDIIGPGDPLTETWIITDTSTPAQTADVSGFLRREVKGDFQVGGTGLVDVAYYEGDSTTPGSGTGATWEYTLVGGWEEL